MTIFVDTSAWFAAANRADAKNAAAKRILTRESQCLTSTFVLAESWRLIAHRIHWSAAENFWQAIRRGACELEAIVPSDLDSAFAIGERFADQEFSLTDRTSFALMERLGISRVASFDTDFEIYRFGGKQRDFFEVVRS